MGVSEARRRAAFADQLSIVLGWELDPAAWEMISRDLAAVNVALDAGDVAEARRLTLVIEDHSPKRLGRASLSVPGTVLAPTAVRETLNHIVHGADPEDPSAAAAPA
jgi:hypothetical protein